MEYHEHRFIDFSLLIFKDTKLVAIMPANKVNDELYSHQGLTYGGLILSPSQQAFEVAQMLDCILEFCKRQSISTLTLKLSPSFYQKTASNEISYFLQKKGGTLIDKKLVLAIDFNKNLRIHKTKRKHYLKNEQVGFDIEQTSDFSRFWNEVLIPKLNTKYGVDPLHSLEEIQRLQHSFPNEILQYNLIYNHKIAAGITLFVSDTVVKSQYAATSLSGEKHRALDYLFISLIEKYKAEGKSFFSMGTVDDGSEVGVNSGMLKQKEELGCGCYTQDIYKFQLA